MQYLKNLKLGAKNDHLGIFRWVFEENYCHI